MIYINQLYRSKCKRQLIFKRCNIADYCKIKNTKTQFNFEKINLFLDKNTAGLTNK